jgi:hypothetical protein
MSSIFLHRRSGALTRDGAWTLSRPRPAKEGPVLPGRSAASGGDHRGSLVRGSTATVSARPDIGFVRKDG